MAQSKDGKRAYRLRKRLAEGRTLAADDQSFLDNWTARVGSSKKGRPRKERAAVADDGQVEFDLPPNAPPDAAAEVAPEFASEPGGETPAPEPPPVRPRAESKARGSKSGNWRDSYRAGAAASEREATCVQVAALWSHLLKKANASIVANGGTPAIPDDVIDGPLGKCLVLTVDKMLPADFSVGPEVEAAVASTVITSQAWFVARRAKKQSAAKSRAARDAAAYVNPDAAPKEPAPVAPILSMVPAPRVASVGDENAVF